MVSRDESNGTLHSDKFSKLQNDPFRCTKAEPNSGQNSGRLLQRYPRHQIHANYSLMIAQINPDFPDPYMRPQLGEHFTHGGVLVLGSD